MLITVVIYVCATGLAGILSYYFGWDYQLLILHLILIYVIGNERRKDKDGN